MIDKGGGGGGGEVRRPFDDRSILFSILKHHGDHHDHGRFQAKFDPRGRDGCRTHGDHLTTTDINDHGRFQR